MLGLSNLNSFFMSDKDASLKENFLSFATLLGIDKILWSFLNLEIASLTRSVISLLLSAISVFSFIPRLFVPFLKTLFILPATTLSLHSMSSFSLTNVILLTVLHFSEKKGWIFFQNVLFLVILLESLLSKKLFLSYFIIYCSNFFSFYFFKKDFCLLLKFVFSNWDLFIIAFYNILVT